MANIAFFLNHIKPMILRRHISFPELNEIKGILLFEEETDFQPGYIYIGDSRSNAVWLREKSFAEPVTLFLADDHNFLDLLFRKKNLNIITVETSLINLYNEINTIVLNYKNWSHSLVKMICEGHDISTIVSSAARAFRGHIFLLNNGYRILACCEERHFNDGLSSELFEKGYLSLSTVAELKKRMNNSSSFCGNIYRFSPCPDKTVYYIRKIEIHDQTVAYLLFAAGEQHKYMDIFDMIDSLGNIITNLLSHSTEATLSSNDVFRTLLSDFAENKMLSVVEINNRFSLLPYQPAKYVYCIIIDCTSNELPLEFLINQLESIFLQSNITIWNNQIVIMHSCEEQVPDITLLFDIDKLNALLTPVGGKAIVSTGTSHYEKFKTIYELNQRLLTILTKMNIQSDYENIYHYNDYSVYLSIDFSTQYYLSTMGHSDIIYLADPAVIKLTRYDKIHNTELRDVLFYYLLNGRSVVKTAKALFMHRNTVLNKLNRINELIELPLEDGRTQHQLLYSCQLIKYYTDFLSLELDSHR